MDPKTIPVLIVIFNRPETTKRLVESLRKIRPTNLYVAADGARIDKLGEKEKCEATRLIIETINWPCTIHKKYSNENQGLDPAVVAGVTWFFENVELGIVLEDDCLPDPTFFDFAGLMLEKYKNDESVMHVNGSNFQGGQKRGSGDYYFSRYPHSWGWATWQRAWKFYDNDLPSFPEFKNSKVIDEMIDRPAEKKFWLTFFQKLYVKKFPFWDSKWTYAVWSHKGVCITPNQNLVRNIGWGENATHTSSYEKNINQTTASLQKVHDPISKTIDEQADQYTFLHYYHRSFWQKLRYKIRQLFK